MSELTSRLGGHVAGLADPFIPDSIRRMGLEPVRRARLILGSSLVSAVLLGVGSVDAYISGLATIAHWPLLAAPLLLLVPFLLRWTGSLALTANVAVAVLALTIGYGNFARAAAGMPPHLATTIVPIVAVLLGGWRAGVFWGGLMVGQFVLLAAANAGQVQLSGFLIPPEAVVEGTERLREARILVVMLALALIYDALKRRSLREAGEARERAERADRVKSAFLATVSHEVRTPLAVIIGMSDMLLDSDLDHDQADLVRSLRRSSGNLLGLVNDVLDLSKIEAGRLEIESIPFDVSAVVSEVKTQLGPAAAAKGIALDLDLGVGLPPRLLGDPSRIRQVLLNLAGNAIKFTSQGGVEVEAEVEQSSRDEVTLAFAVTDTGVGIPADDLPRLFERFTQIDTSTARLSGGSGLGLPISQELVTRMKGQLVVTSQPGHGSRFSFSLPLPVAPEPRIDRAVGKARIGAESASGRREPEPAPRKTRAPERSKSSLVS